MKSKMINAGIFAMTLLFVLVFTGCETMTSNNSRSRSSVEKVSWIDYTVIPSKDYTVVGAIVLRANNIRAINADLMEKAIEMEAHDIINIRIDMEYTSDDSRVSAVAIRYTETMKIGDLYIFGKPNNNASVSNESVSPAEKKKFLGLF